MHILIKTATIKINDNDISCLDKADTSKWVRL